VGFCVEVGFESLGQAGFAFGEREEGGSGPFGYWHDRHSFLLFCFIIGNVRKFDQERMNERKKDMDTQ
jgi:hypothetical protein